jgi:hypothetical protein
MVGGVRNIEVAAGIYGKPFGLSQLGRDGLTAVAYHVAASHGCELVNHGCGGQCGFA